ncbi:post-GPI attachment to proteins factor 3 isoform X2 [Orussus abietinus]|uniref:post-GPI attachment to proteins factor 3 isoform X2 n=1 Tax=Orussus abietinus TaxID=222816 RepID=UPI0006264BD5|nr:post-GPI attachment to proteins factor 3 isoform X2 [Orussus abietinus]
MPKKISALLILTINLLISDVCVGSNGDTSRYYRQCLSTCKTSSRERDIDLAEPGFFTSRTLLSSQDDCKYTCMWDTVNYFTSRGLQVPQFHGKWPFIRMFGLQEPASVLFSVLNFFVSWKMYGEFRKEVQFDTPMYLVWSYFSLVGLHGWLWSSIFHAQDNAFTEAMDYSCAFGIVLTLLCCLLFRLTYKRRKVLFTIICGYVSMLYTHLSHLWSGRINYGYNMKLNILLGLVTSIMTLVWWYRNYKRLEHIRLIGWFNVLSVSSTLLEVTDFPPIFWIFDAHSLWHASSAPLIILLYRFIIKDCLYLKKYSAFR